MTVLKSLRGRLAVITPLLIVDLLVLVGGYTRPLGPTISGDVQVGSSTLVPPEAHF